MGKTLGRPRNRQNKNAELLLAKERQKRADLFLRMRGLQVRLCLGLANDPHGERSIECIHVWDKTGDTMRFLGP